MTIMPGPPSVRWVPYTLYGGNTGSIVMNGKLINRSPFGYKRSHGDLIYFATALPETK